MLRRPWSLHRHLARPTLLTPSSRPVLHSHLPLQSRFYARPAHKGPHPLWFVGTVIIGFTSFFFIVKARRGLGTLTTFFVDIDPMNREPTDDIRLKEDKHKLPVLKRERKDPMFSKEHVHVIFVLGTSLALS
jgi:hypothetical protein